MEVLPGCMLQIMNKSGVASKKSLVTGACVVDEATGKSCKPSQHWLCTNIEPGQKIAQGVFVRIEKPILWEIDEDSIYGTQTARGSALLAQRETSNGLC